MPQRLVLIHTVPPLVEVFTRLAAELLPGVQLFHVLDEPLLEHVRAHGGLDPTDMDRLAAHVAAAVQIDAAAVLVTCSTVSPAVDGVRPIASIPVFKIDEAMIAQAVRAQTVRAGPRIGVIATNRTTLAPTGRLLEAEAARTGKPIAVELVMVDDALPALLAGDGATHDRLVLAALHRLILTVDVVVLAQASIARILAALDPAALPVPVLASPHLALAQVRAALAEPPAVAGQPAQPELPSAVMPRPPERLSQDA